MHSFLSPVKGIDTNNSIQPLGIEFLMYFPGQNIDGWVKIIGT